MKPYFFSGLSTAAAVIVLLWVGFRTMPTSDFFMLIYYINMSIIAFNAGVLMYFGWLNRD